MDSNDPKTAIELYFQGHATGDSSFMRRAFMPSARIEGYRGETFLSWALDEYCGLFTGSPASDESIRTRVIDFLDVEGGAAIAKATLVHGAITFTDYFLLLKMGDEWKIANKSFSSRPTQAN